MKTENKLYVIEYNGDNCMNKGSHIVIVIAASSKDIAREHVKKQIGLDIEPIWLMGSAHPTIYTQDGDNPVPVQAKILYNGHCTYSK